MNSIGFGLQVHGSWGSCWNWFDYDQSMCWLLSKLIRKFFPLRYSCSLRVSYTWCSASWVLGCTRWSCERGYQWHACTSFWICHGLCLDDLADLCVCVCGRRDRKILQWHCGHLSLTFDEYLDGRYFLNLGLGLYCRNGMIVAPWFSRICQGTSLGCMLLEKTVGIE